MAEPGRGRLTSARFLALLLALLFYAAWGTPTPDDFGMAEGIVALLLVVAVGPPGIAAALRARQEQGWQPVAQLLLLYGLSVPVFVGLAAGNDPLHMIRDALAFLFLLLPLFLYPLARQGIVRAVILTMAVATIGLAFAGRVLLPRLLDTQKDWSVPARLYLDDPGYMANAPTVLFAAILLIGLAGLWVYIARPARVALPAAAMLAAGALPFVTMALIQQRASIGLTLVMLVLLLAAAFCKRPYRALPLLAAAGAVLVLVAPWLGAVIAVLWQKTATVGLNMRWQEAEAVLAAVGDDPAALLWGRGWGALLESPAVGAYPVNFTHNIFTSFWLKTGLCGVALVGLYLAALGRLLLPLCRSRPVLAAALAAPLAIDTVLYASFKSLDFGLILLLLAVWGARAVSLHPAPLYSMARGSPEPRMNG